MDSKLTVKVGADINELKRELKQASGELNQFSGMAKKAGAMVAGAFTVDLMLDFGRQIIETTAKFQKFEAVLTNTLGSNSEAKKALADITDFAAKTPFQVDELTASFVKLVNQGFKPTFQQMTSLGDLAASQGKSFDQLTEAIIDAQTGEFERLKEFGVRASKQGDQVKFTFKGVETQVKFTSESIREYILSLGSAEGVSGSMAAISQTLGGKISNLQDSFDQLKLSLGQTAESGGLVSMAIDGITTSVQKLTEWVKDGSVEAFLKSFAPMAKELSAILQVYKELNKESEDATWLKETDAKIIEEVWGKAAEEVKKVVKPLTDLQKAVNAIDWRTPEVEKFKDAIKPDSFDPDSPMGQYSMTLPAGVFDPVPGIVAETTANQDLAFSLYDVAVARERQLAAEIAAQEAMAQSLLIAQELGAGVGESFAMLASGMGKEEEAIMHITKVIVDQLYKQAVAAVIANSAKLGIFGVGAAIAGLTFIKAMFSQLGASGGGGGSGGGGNSRAGSGPVSLKNGMEDSQHIQLGGFVTVKGEDLIIAFKNAEQKQGSKRG